MFSNRICSRVLSLRDGPLCLKQQASDFMRLFYPILHLTRRVVIPSSALDTSLNCRIRERAQIVGNSVSYHISHISPKPSMHTYKAVSTLRNLNLRSLSKVDRSRAVLDVVGGKCRLETLCRRLFGSVISSPRQRSRSRPCRLSRLVTRRRRR